MLHPGPFCAMCVRTEEGDPISVWATNDTNGERYAIDESSLLPRSWTEPIRQVIRRYRSRKEQETVLQVNAGMTLWEDLAAHQRHAPSVLRLVNWSGWPIVEFREQFGPAQYWLGDVDLVSLQGDEVYATKLKCQCFFYRQGRKMVVDVPGNRQVFLTTGRLSVRVVRKMFQQVIELTYR